MPLFESKDFNEFMSAGEQAFEFIFNLLYEILNFIRFHPLLYVPIFLITLLGITFLVGWIILEVSNSSYSTSWYYNPNKFYSSNIPAVMDIWHLHKRRINAKKINTSSYSKNNDYRVYNLNKQISKKYPNKKSSNYEVIRVPKRKPEKRNYNLDIEYEE